MDSAQVLSLIAAILIGLMALLHFLLAAGLPFGKAAWGGAHRVLPSRLRLGSLAAMLILGFSAWVILARASLVSPGAGATWVRVSSWIFAGYLALNTLANLASHSRIERTIMTPITAFLTVAFVFVSLS